MTSLVTEAGENIAYYMEEGSTLDELIADGSITEEAELADITGVDSSYLYIVDGHTSTMLYHPTESKIGSPVENSAVQGLVSEIAAGRDPGTGFVEYDFKGTSKYAAYYTGDNGDYILVLTADRSDVFSTVYTTIKIAAGAAAGMVLACALILIPLSGMVSKPLNQAAGCLTELSTGNLSGAHMDANSHIREVHAILDAAGNLKDALTDSSRRMTEHLSVLRTEIDDVGTHTKTNSENVEQINAAIEEVAETSQSLAKSAQELSDRTVEIGENVTELNSSVEALDASGTRIREANTQAAQQMKSVMDSSARSVEAVESIVTELKNTDEAMKDIQTCVSVINDIASQTKLLSLNASIEAARAGESGKGFSVVAENIRDLAESSSENAARIGDIIERVTELSGKSVQAANAVRETIRGEQASIASTQEKFSVLSDAVESSLLETSTVSEKTKQLNALKSVLADAAESLGDVSQQLGASTEEVSASAQTVAEECQNTLGNTERMTDAGTVLSKSVEFFH
jgi:methyl-accepting chemotaxis protein